MYMNGLSNLRGDDEVWGASVGENLPVGWDTIPAVEQSGTLGDPWLQVITQGVSIAAQYANTRSQQEYNAALAKQGIVPPGYTRPGYPLTPLPAGYPVAAGYSPFQAAQGSGFLSPTILLLIAAGVAAYILMQK